ncbi:MAG: cell division protein FtsA, partial [Patescibacteria group bacterium]|nr:cell division protein FtsA [Patescibacteria group bacterium]
MKLVDKYLKKEPKVPHYVALDIGTEFVKALIFKIVDGKGVVVGAGRQRQRLGDMHGGAVTDIAGVVENCSHALDRAE